MVDEEYPNVWRAVHVFGLARLRVRAEPERVSPEPVRSLKDSPLIRKFVVEAVSNEP